MDVFDNEGKSALHLAGENGSIEVCEALLTRNAFINSKTKFKNIHLAKYNLILNLEMKEEAQKENLKDWQRIEDSMKVS